MNIAVFWKLLAGSLIGVASQEEREERLVTWLRAMSLPDIVGFQAIKDQLIRRVDTHEMRAAHRLIMGGNGGGDPYFYFLHWLIGLGQETYERVVADVEALLDVRDLPRPLGGHAEWAFWPEWEGLLSIAAKAYAAANGTELGGGPDPRTMTNSLYDPETRGDWDSFDMNEVSRRLPRFFEAARPGLDPWFLKDWSGSR